MNGMTHRVFVYGTLKRGHGNWHHFLRNAHFAGEAESPKAYRMIAGGFPVILETDEEPRSVAGELFHVNDDTLRRLDNLEGEGSMYHRRVIDVFEYGYPVKAFAYIGDSEYWEFNENHYVKCNDEGALDWQRD